MVVTGTHDPYLVALSILVACFASYTALDLGGHVAAARGLARRVWLVAAAITMGGGIWSMHFVAMLAFIMPMPMSYDIGLTILSLMVAILVTGGGFYVISRQSASPLRLVLSGIFMGLGIVAMHYTGMAAMRGHVELSYDRLYVALSVIIAIGASTAALWLAFRTTDLGQKLVAAVVMGLAISGMHYTAMRGDHLYRSRPGFTRPKETQVSIKPLWRWRLPALRLSFWPSRRSPPCQSGSAPKKRCVRRGRISHTSTG